MSIFARTADYYNEQFAQVLLPRGTFPIHSALLVAPISSELQANILVFVAQERERQDAKWGGAEHDDTLPTQFFIQTIEDYAGWARVMANMGSTERARTRLIQVAALAVAAVEAIDRRPKAGRVGR